MREKWNDNAPGISSRKFLAIIFVTLSTVTCSYAQGSTEAETMRARLARARALAAAHNLAAAANELDSIRKSTTDDSVRDVARLMLMGVCLEEGNYMRAQMLLEEIYTARSAQNESSAEAYFALAGQALNGAREHLERYRAFGINVTDKDLPSDAISDLDRLRTLLEKIADQARLMTAQDARASAAAALLEDVSSLRASLARSQQERQQWQREMASARQKLSAEEARMTPVSGTVSSPRNASAIIAGSSIAQSATQNTTPALASNSPAATKPPIETSAAATGKRSEPQAPSTTATAETDGGAKSQEGKAVNVGSLLDKATQKINPSYPYTAKTARITGIVTVYVEVDPTGVVSTVQTTSGPSMLRQAAMDAARRWKFRPTLIDGQPVRVVGFINFNFTL